MVGVKKYLLLVIMLLSMAGFAGCTQKNKDNEAGIKPAYLQDELPIKEDDGIYQSSIKRIDFGDGNYAYTQVGCVVGDTVYYIQSKWDEEIGSNTELLYPFDAKTGEPSGTGFGIREDDRYLSISNLTAYGDTGFVFTTASYENNDWTRPLYCVYTCSLDGTILNKKQLPEIPQIPEYSGLFGGIISDGTNIYIFTDKKAVMLDSDLRFRKVFAEGGNLKGCIGSNGLVYFIKDFSGEISVYDPVSDKVTESVAKMASAEYLYTGEAGEILVESGNSLKSFNTVTGEITKLFDFLDVNITPAYKGQIYRDSDRNIHYHFSELDKVERDDGMGGTRQDMVSSPYEAVIRRFEPGSVPEPEVIMLACRYANPDIRKTVKDFNNAHPEIRVKIQVYSDEYADEDAFEEAYDKDILNGLVYDVIMFDIATDIDKYTEKGLIEDLMPYIEKDSSFDSKEYFENILFAQKKNNKLYSIVSGATLSGFVYNSDVFGKRDKLTMEDIYKEREKRPDIPFMQYGTDLNVLFTFLNYDYRLFLGGAEDVYNFDTDEFKRLCEYATTFKRSTDEFIPAYGYSAIADGTEVVGFSHYYCYSDCLYDRAGYSKNVRSCGGPSLAGNGYYIEPTRQYSISSMSSHKEEAWSLIKSILNDTTYGSITEFKAYRKACNEELNDLYQRCKDGFCVSMGGVTYQLSMDKSDFDMFTKMIEGAAPKFSPNPVVRQIVLEEIPAYFTGAKSLDEVIGIIQSRVNLFLTEKE